MAKKNNKRRHNRTVELKRQVEQEKLTEEKDRARKRMDPTARMLLHADIVFLAVFAVLDSRGLLSDLVDGLCAIVGAALLLVALWFQFGQKGDGRRKGPRL